MASTKTKPMHKSGPARLQPIRATKPFQLKSPSSSPTPRSTNESRVVGVRNRWSSDHRSSPDRTDRKSPNSASIKVPKGRSPSPSIRRTSSLDTIAGPYLTGQWPRDGTALQLVNQLMRDKTTQTPDWSVEGVGGQFQPLKSSSKSGHGRTPAIPEADYKIQFFRRMGKSRHKKERSPPVHGNHNALQQMPTGQARSMSNPISISNGSVQPFGRVPRRQNSTEALNTEIDQLISTTSSGVGEPRAIQGVTPPDGHRAPIPRSTTRSMETQTPQDNAREGNESSPTSPAPSPSLEQHITKAAQTITINELDTKDCEVSPCPKYASSPRPNNSYTFKREPPEGAESVKPFKEQDLHQQVSPSCPDKNKVNFIPKQSSAFVPAFKSKLHDACETLKPPAVILEQNNNNSSVTALTAPLISNLLAPIAGTQQQSGTNNSPTPELILAASHDV